MKLAIIKYNAGNIQSLKFGLERVGIEPVVTDDPDEIRSADKIIFPGQGEASSAMKYLKSHNLDHVLTEVKQPFLGVCLGMQLMCESSEENDSECLGIIPLKVKKFDGQHKVPHMGWNTIENLNSPLFSTLDDKSYLYFVHSYFVPDSEYSIATTEYGVKFSSALQKDNYFAVQAHPEKSSTAGEVILKNFLSMQ